MSVFFQRFGNHISALILSLSIFYALSKGHTANAREISVQHLGLVDDATCRFDQTDALQRAILKAAGGLLQLPAGTFCVKRADGTLKVSAPHSQISGMGQSTILRWAAPKGSRIAPLIDILPAATNASISNLSFDHQADKNDYADSRYFGTDPWGGVMVSIQADNFTGKRLWGRAGFDNCFGIAEMGPDNKVRPQRPKGVRLSLIRTRACGSGTHSPDQGGPGRIGAGIDNGSGSGTQISDASDVGSFGSFIADIGAGGSAIWRNITSTRSRIDLRSPPALYVGDPDNKFYAVRIVVPQGDGIWSDGPAKHSVFSNIMIVSPRAACLHVKGPSRWNQVVCDVSKATFPIEAAIKVDATLDLVDVDITNFILKTNGNGVGRLVNIVGGRPYRMRLHGTWPRDTDAQAAGVHLVRSQPNP